MPEEVVLISRVKKAVGKFCRAFKGIPAQELSARVIKEAVNRACIQIHEVGEVAAFDAHLSLK